MRRFFLGLVSLPIVSFALTQAEVEQAVYAALTSVPLNMSGAQINVVPWPYPSIQTMTLGEYFLYNLGGSLSYSSRPDGTIFDNIVTLRKVAESIGAFTNDLSDVQSDVASISSDVEGWSRAWGNWSWAVEQMLQQLTSNFSTFEDSFASYSERMRVYQHDLTNLVVAASNQLASVRDWLDDVSRGNVTVQVDFDETGSAYNVFQNILNDFDAQLDLSAEYEYQLQMIGASLEQLYSWFLQNGSNVDIVNRLTGIAGDLGNIAANLTNNIVVEVPSLADGLAITNWPSTLTDTAWWDDMRSLSYARNATLADTYVAVTNLSGFASNIMASIVLTPESQRQFEVHSNAVESALSTNLTPAFEVADDVSGVISNKVDDMDSSFQFTLNYDRFRDNPYDDADQMENDFASIVGNAFQAGNESFDPEVIIFGSDDRPMGSASRPDLTVRLPRLAFNLNTVTTRWHSTGVLRSVMVAVWMFISFVAKAVLIKDFLAWYSTRQKRV